MRRTVRPVVGLALLLGSAWVGACLDDDPLGTLPPPPPPRAPAPIVSNPIAAPAATSSAAVAVAGRSSGTEVVYVSLPPGTIPDGGLATIRNTRTGASAAAAMAAGGFDPVTIEASAGDTLALQVQRTEGAPALTFSLVVLARRPPVVVRTDPPPRKRDVPLNAAIVVVFSEPISPATAGSVRLLRTGAPVSGSVAVTAGGLRAEFTPSGLLAPNADYVLSVPTDVTDLSGDALAQNVEVDFTTGTSTALAMVYADPAALYVISGYPRLDGRLRTFEFSAILHDDGRVTGSYRLFYQETGWGNSGTVRCFSIKGDTAWIAGVIEASGSNPETIGHEIGWLAVDRGPAGSGVGDRLTLAFVGLALGGFGTSRDFCDNQSTRIADGPEAGTDLPVQTVEDGDIVVTGSAPTAPRGAIRVMTRASGAPDPDGYGLLLCRDGDPCPKTRSMHANDDVTVARLLPGSHTVTLTPFWGWDDCTVVGANPRTVDISPSDTAEVLFDVACADLELLVPYRSVGYRFKVLADSSIGGGGFELPGFDDVAAGFSDGGGAFGSQDGDDFEGCPLYGSDSTYWSRLTDLLLRKTFDLPSGSRGVTVRVAIDDHVQVFVNGVDITASGVPNTLAGGFQRHEGCAERDSFVFPVPDAILRTGSNVLAVRARDQGVISYADLRVTAERE